MKIWCLTSIRIGIVQSPNDPNEDYLSCISAKNKHNFFQSMLDSEKYMLTQIYIGRNEDGYIFEISRDDLGVLTFDMKHRHLLPTTFTDSNQIVIDIEHPEDIYFSKTMGSAYYNRRREQYVRNIRVRNIKYTTNTVLTVAEKSAYLNYAHKIEEYAKNDSAKREEAFTKFKLTTRKDEPLRNKRVEDLLTALRDLCDPPDGRIVQRENTRYNHALPVNTDIEIKKKNDRTFIRLDDFSKTRSIYVDGIFLKDIYSKWFEAKNLTALHLINVSPFETFGSWKRFENGIQKCSKLQDLSLSYCNIKDISDEIFKALPTSIINLDLSGNDLTRISPLITRLSNLEIIVFSNNKNLGDDGFPWDGIPETCTMMYLDNVKLTKVPHTIRRLIKLEILQISGPWLEEVSWESINTNIESLDIKFSGICNLNIYPLRNAFSSPDLLVSSQDDKQKQPIVPLKLRRNLSAPFKLCNITRPYCNPIHILPKLLNLEDITIKNAGLTEHIWDKIPQNAGSIKLSSNKFTTLDSHICHQNLRYINFKNNKITTVNWANLQHCFPRLSSFNLANNMITTVTTLTEVSSCFNHFILKNNHISQIDWFGLPKELITLDLSFNKIYSMSSIVHMEHLHELDIESNNLETLPIGFENMKQLSILNLANNKLTCLPNGFENKNHFGLLDLSDNNFTEQITSSGSSLTEKLWNRLPKRISHLKLNSSQDNKNTLNELPCQLSNIFWDRIDAENCHITHICPKLYKLQRYEDTKILNILGNPELQHLSFIPKSILYPPNSTKTPDKSDNDKNYDKEKFALISNINYRNTAIWYSTNKIHTYKFVKFDQTEKEKRLICQCCAGLKDCKTDNCVIEQFMTMDYCLHHVEENKIASANITQNVSKNLKHMKWYSGKWKTKVRTKMCDECVKIFTDNVQEFYQKYNHEQNENELQDSHRRKTKGQQNPSKPNNTQLIEPSQNLKTLINQNAIQQPAPQSLIETPFISDFSQQPQTYRIMNPEIVDPSIKRVVILPPIQSIYDHSRTKANNTQSTTLYNITENMEPMQASLLYNDPQSSRTHTNKTIQQQETMEWTHVQMEDLNLNGSNWNNDQQNIELPNQNPYNVPPSDLTSMIPSYSGQIPCHQRLNDNSQLEQPQQYLTSYYGTGDNLMHKQIPQLYDGPQNAFPYANQPMPQNNHSQNIHAQMCDLSQNLLHPNPNYNDQQNQSSLAQQNCEANESGRQNFSAASDQEFPLYNYYNYDS